MILDFFITCEWYATMLQMSAAYQLIWWNKYHGGIDKVLIILLASM